MLTSLFVLISEAALSLYPILIKKVSTTIGTQLLSRLVTYSILGFLFASTSDIKQTWATSSGITRSLSLGFMTLIHIASSYFAFDSLPTGVSMSLFYLYPIFNLIGAALFFNESFGLTQVLLVSIAFIGSILVSFSLKDDDSFTSTKSIQWKGIVSALIAAVTESGMYFAVRTAKQPNPFYAILELYPGALPLLLASLFYFSKESPIDTNLSNWSSMTLFNTCIGFVGYCLRFFAIPRISTVAFSLLSFVGVLTSFIWGYLFVSEVPTSLSVLGGTLIAAAASFVKSQ